MGIASRASGRFVSGAAMAAGIVLALLQSPAVGQVAQPDVGRAWQTPIVVESPIPSTSVLKGPALPPWDLTPPPLARPIGEDGASGAILPEPPIVWLLLAGMCIPWFARRRHVPR